MRAPRPPPPARSPRGPAPLFRIRNRERVQLVVKTTRRAEAIAQVGEAVEAVATDKRHRDVTLSVDVDPQ